MKFQLIFKFTVLQQMNDIPTNTNYNVEENTNQNDTLVIFTCLLKL